VNLDKFEQGGAKLEELAGPEVRAKAPYASGGKIPLVDAWLFARLAATVEMMNDALANYRFHEAAQGVYQFFWGDFCDWYIEWVKPELQSADRERATVAWKNLFAAFDAALRLLHPFMPFLTEELWHQLPQKAGAKSIALNHFPEVQAHWQNPKAIDEVGLIQEVVTKLRVMRAEQKQDVKKKLPAELSSGNPALRNLLEDNSPVVQRLAVLSSFDIGSERLKGIGMMLHTATYDLRIPFEALIDLSAEIARLKKEIERLEKDIQSKKARLHDEDFTKKAPEHVVKNMGIAMVERQLQQEKLKAQLEQLEGSQTVET
jgi:valyl-tRNA synthetase